MSETYCEHCGNAVGEVGHEACRLALRMEPPRYCADCRRRMIVQVTPTGWTARCVEHGALTSTLS